VTRTELSEHDIVGIRAANPGPFTLNGTNTWVVGSDPAWLVDPGPALPEHHQAIVLELERRGGLGGIALTHDHHDHADGVAAIRERYRDAPLATGRGLSDVRLVDGVTFGPLRGVATPGHAPDHFSFVHGRAALTGDAVLGEGSVFIAPDPQALTGYLEGLRKLRQLPLDVLLPGHGPVVVEPHAKLDEYVSHRLDRERRLVAALTLGARTVDELLDAAWTEVPEVLRPAATVTLAAHLDKLADEGRLPDGVQRPIKDALTLSEPNV
jgi:glyoxylase-like metal-dependent hydrolase (beta-lactamase superfamily II)